MTRLHFGSRRVRVDYVQIRPQLLVSFEASHVSLSILVVNDAVLGDADFVDRR